MSFGARSGALPPESPYKKKYENFKFSYRGFRGVILYPRSSREIFTPDELSAYATYKRLTPAERIYFACTDPGRTLVSPRPSCKPETRNPKFSPPPHYSTLAPWHAHSPKRARTKSERFHRRPHTLETSQPPHSLTSLTPSQISLSQW